MEELINEVLDFCKIDSDQVDDETKSALGSILAANTIKELEAIMNDEINIPASANCHEIEDVVKYRIDVLKQQYGL